MTRADVDRECAKCGTFAPAGTLRSGCPKCLACPNCGATAWIPVSPDD